MPPMLDFKKWQVLRSPFFVFGGGGVGRVLEAFIVVPTTRAPTLAVFLRLHPLVGPSVGSRPTSTHETISREPIRESTVTIAYPGGQCAHIAMDGRGNRQHG